MRKSVLDSACLTISLCDYLQVFVLEHNNVCVLLSAQLGGLFLIFFFKISKPSLQDTRTDKVCVPVLQHRCSLFQTVNIYLLSKQSSNYWELIWHVKRFSLRNLFPFIYSAIIYLNSRASAYSSEAPS